MCRCRCVNVVGMSVCVDVGVSMYIVLQNVVLCAG